jgi:hypothetical protein
VSNRNLPTKKLSPIPPHIQQLWGPSPVLASENLEAYQRLALEIAESVQPSDVLDWLMVKDGIDLSWEIRRLRRFKAKYIEIRPSQLSPEAIRHGRERFGGDVKLSVILEDEVTDGFFRALQDYALIDALLASAESRRAATLREIERWRDIFASRLRKASDQAIDGGITDNFRGPAAPANPRQVLIAKHAPKIRTDGAAAAVKKSRTTHQQPALGKPSQ